MKKIIVLFFLSILSFVRVYSQTVAVSDCTPNIENMFKVNKLKIKYETVQHIYEKHKFLYIMSKDTWSRYFELIRGYPLEIEEQEGSIPEKGAIITVKPISEEEINRYIEQLNCTPEQALDEYKSLIRNIKSEKEIYLKCIDTEIEKGDLSEYASTVILPYGFMPPGWSIVPPPTNLSKLDFLKVFKEFIFNSNEDVLPKGTRVVRYLNRLAQGYVNSEIVHEFEFDKESFLIGTLDDYMGHQQTFTIGQDSSSFLINELKKANNIDILKQAMESAGDYYQCVDSYYPGEKNLALLIHSFFSREFPDLHLVDKDCEGKCIRLYSASLTEIINGYYDYEQSGSRIGTLFLDTVYQGSLKPEKLQTISQKLSFLTGAMLRDGHQSRLSGYYLSMPNSRSKAKLCSELLAEFKCNNILHQRYVDRIPSGNEVYFAPSETISKLIEKVITVKENLENDEAAKSALIAKIK
ncbi:MAG: hypothetical protein LBS55_08475 [Prevotellaceae bacterium]|jgi:hypothetical protein|nr:hypothetical protein [Prevotellaceae bacterium]